MPYLFHVGDNFNVVCLDLLNGSKSPVIPSPPLTGQGQHIYPQSIDPGKHHIMELLGAYGRLPGQVSPAAEQLLQQTGHAGVRSGHASGKGLCFFLTN